MKKYYILIAIVTFSVAITAQSLSKADKLFDHKSYIKATEIYKKIAIKKPSQEVYQKLGDCYFFNSKMKKAVTWYEKLVTEYPNDVSATYVLRYIQTLKSLKQYQKVDTWTEKYNDLSMTASINPTNTVDLVKKLSHSVIKNMAVQNIESNSSNSDFAPAIYNGKLVFASARSNSAKLYAWNGEPYLDLYTASINDDNAVSNAIPFSEEINSERHEASVAFTNDGNTMYFSRNSDKKGENKISNLKIYKATLVDGKWSNIKELPFSNNNYSVTHPALNADNTKMYFSSDMPGSLADGFDIYEVSINNDGTFGEPKNLGTKINTTKREQFPFISSANELYFASEGHPGLGGLDIFKSTYKNGFFSNPKNLGIPFNSSLDDFSYIIDEQKQTGFFASNRMDGKGDDDIYSFHIESLVLYGKVLDKVSGELVPDATVVLLDAKGNKIDEKVVGADAYYEFDLDTKSAYTLKGNKDLYVPSEIDFQTDYKGDINKDILLELITYVDADPKIEIINEKPQIVLNPIYFDFDKWNIRPDAARELDHVVSIMQKYPEMVIAIGSHTDSRGTDSYNMKLSKKRAKSTLNYIISKGVNAANISAQGYGESQAINNCASQNNCTEQDFDLNRRSEFVLIK